MRIYHLVFVAYLMQKFEISNGKHVHIKIHVPNIIHKHNHKHKVIVHKKPHGGGGEKKHVVIHKHNHEHNHKHDHKHTEEHKPKKYHHEEKHHHEKKHHHEEKHHHKETHHKPFSEHKPLVIEDHWLNNQAEKVEDQKVQNLLGSLRNNQLKSSLKTEHVEITQINPLASKSEDKVNIRGSYRVQESDPYDDTTSSYYEYDSPFTKEIAKTLTNFKEYFEEPYENHKSDEDNGNDIQEYDDYRNYGEQHLKQVILYKSNDEKSSSGY